MPFFRRRREPEGVPVDVTAGDPRGEALVTAIAADDLEALRAVLGSATAPDVRERLTMMLAGVPGHVELFDAWVDREPAEPTAWLARGAYRVSWAWEARGHAYADDVDEGAWDVFFDRLRLAEDDLARAIELDAADPVPWSHLLTSGRGLQVPKEELWMRYEEAQARHPWLLEAHFQLQQSLCAKWSGSDEQALELARRVDRDAPEGAGVRALVPMAHLEVWVGQATGDDGGDADGYAARGDVLDEIRAAAERSVFADGFADDLISVPALNVFTFGLWRFGDEAGAQTLARRLGPRRTRWPWLYLANPGRVYARLLAA